MWESNVLVLDTLPETSHPQWETSLRLTGVSEGARTSVWGSLPRRTGEGSSLPQVIGRELRPEPVY